ncbi:PstS family phosphate ABC transporter substrate-binding protein [Halalkalibacter hemicellulosilyticus]|uniref:Phosphate-binding protein n=1 Tax=Halalkalibacter hemicellulosilyticusJCM 9152 TaxID=1236971 RepID=W4QGF1_9BACI|nr:PstS family phosphate ABC transporter substrate-binding protein [Halalkalibacter hemicellulosilyticus]GAE31166.1 phosphate ABC transporter [Halalkalibacter hemicellulosilyticusJCM 9152]
MKKLVMLLMMAVLMLVAVACGSADETDAPEENTGGTETEETTDDTEDGDSSEGTAEELSGSVVVDGSGTVYPLMSVIAEDYMLNGQQGVSVEVSRAGTSAGFQRFLAEDGTDFNDASREIKEEELEIAEELGIEVQEFKVALDGLTFVIHPDNDWATELTDEQLINIFKHDGGVTKWSDLDPSFPDDEIKPMGPNENHGTYEFFYEVILEKEDLVDSVNLQQEYSTLVNLVSEDVNGIAFFGFGYYVNNQDQLQAVNVDFGSGPVAPSLDTIDESGDYAPFTRPVFTYLNVDMAKEKPQVLDFAYYVVNNVNNFAGETGFAPLPEEEIQSYIEVLDGLK